jgi:hypothetical protein
MEEILREWKVEYKDEKVGDLSNSEMNLKGMNDSLFHGPSYSIADKLKENGYEISGHGGIKREYPLYSFMGILRNKKSIQKKFCGIKWNKVQRADNLGKLWLNNSEKNAEENKSWTLEVYGKEHESNLVNVIKGVSDSYNVNLHVCIRRETPKKEVYLYDLANK